MELPIQMATNLAPLIEITILLLQVAPSHVMEPGGIMSVRGQIWMDFTETEVVWSVWIVISGIRLPTALVELRRHSWWFDVFDNAVELCLKVYIYVYRQ